MKTISIISVIVILIALIHVADAQGEFDWRNYVGTTHWRVQVTENEGGCGEAAPLRSVQDITINHNFEIADIGDYGHGDLRGTFTARNNLHVPQVTIPDEPGQSTLEPHDMLFSNDCQGFLATYGWTYNGPEQTCSGTTELQGTRTDGQGCPELGGANEITKPGPEQPTSDEQKLLDKLAKNPNDFWANWDMANLMKEKGDAEDLFKYFQKALESGNFDQETREKLKQEELKQLGLSNFPTKGTSPILRVETDQADDNSYKGWIYNTNIKETTTDDNWHIIHWIINDDKFGDVVNKIVGVSR